MGFMKINSANLTDFDVSETGKIVSKILKKYTSRAWLRKGISMKNSPPRDVTNAGITWPVEVSCNKTKYDLVSQILQFFILLTTSKSKVLVLRNDNSRKL